MTDDFFPRDTEGLTEVVPTRTLRLRDGDHIDLRISPVTKHLGGDVLRMLAYDGSIPGPTLHVDQGSELTVHVQNDGDLETTVHWHGLRLENQYDGVPFETQPPIPIGGSLHAEDHVPRRRVLLVPPAHPRGLRIGARSLRHDHRRTLRSVVLAPGRPAPDDHARRSPRRGRQGRAVQSLRSHLHGHGSVRQRHADQRRPRALGGGRGRRSRTPLRGEHCEHTHLQRRSRRRPRQVRRRRQRSLRTRVASSTPCCSRHPNAPSSTCCSRRQAMFAWSTTPLIMSTTSARSP